MESCSPQADLIKTNSSRDLKSYPLNMKKFLDKLSIEWVLRLSLGFMYFFSGVDLFRNPKSWYWAVKPLGSIVYKIGIDRYLKIQGIGELVLAAILLFSFVPRVLVTIVAGLTVIEMAVILGLIGIDAI